MLKSLVTLLPDIPDVQVVDIGASPIDGAPPYQPMRAANKVDLVAIEPDEKQFAALQAQGLPRTRIIQAAVGDGNPATLNICKAPGMTSLLEPDMAVLAHFQGFSEWGTVIKRQPIATRRLDDIPEAQGCHYLKLDVQGGELAILRHAKNTLKDCLVVHTEVQFVPFYRDQPLFAELDQVLRASGFWLHQFLPIHSRILKPLFNRDDPYAGMSEALWSDAIYVRRFTDFPEFDEDSLYRIALILHDLYGSIDLAALALQQLDLRDGGNRHLRYIHALAE